MPDKRRPPLDLSATHQPRILDKIKSEFKKERNKTYENFKFLLRKQHINESLENFHSVLIGLAARCNLGNLEGSVLKIVLIVSKNNREAQNEFVDLLRHWRKCAGTNMQKHTYRHLRQSSSPGSTGWAFQVENETKGVWTGGYRINRSRGRRTYKGRGLNRSELQPTIDATIAIHQTSHASTWIDIKRAGNLYFVLKNKITVRTYLQEEAWTTKRAWISWNNPVARESRFWWSTGIVGPHFPISSSIDWIKPGERMAHSWDSDSSGDYMVMTIRHEGNTELKIGPVANSY